METNRIKSRRKLRHYCMLLMLVLFGLPTLQVSLYHEELFGAFMQGYEEGRNDAKDNLEHPGKNQDKEQVSPLTVVAGPLVAIALFCSFIAFWVYFIYVIINIERGNVLEWCVPTGLKYMGYFLIVFYFIMIAMWFCDEEKSFRVLCEVPFSILIFGCGLLMTGDVIEMARKMKMEQDLTI